MMTTKQEEDRSALNAYEAFAETYDAFTHGVYQYERWTGRLLAQAEKCGLEGNRLLDVACGTGLSFLPMLERGWQVTGCDLSPAMVEVARTKVGDEVELHVADMRELPLLGEFDLIWSLNDSLNYLLSVEEMRSALRSMARNLAPRGILLFDLNTLRSCRSFFSEDQTREADGRRFVWTGRKDQATGAPGSLFEGRYEVEGEGESHVHRQRHFAPAEVLASIEAAGLRCLAALGEREGELEDGLDESVHTTAAYLATHRDADQPLARDARASG